MPKAKIHSLLDRLNSSEVAGVVPGSLRVSEAVRTVGSRLKTSQQYTFSANELSTDGALVGSMCELVVVASARKADGTNIVAATPTSFREEAANLVWRDISLVINETEIAHGVRADVVRYVIDRYHENNRHFLLASPLT